MSLETEAILDRRRLRRKLGLWRSLTIIALVAALAVIASLASGDASLIGQQQIARVDITGIITEDRKQIEMLRKIAKADHVKGVILAINSPGGTTTGAEALFEEIRALSKKKPVVAQFGTVAASAAYITGLACDHIVARSNTITGSVGVIMQWPEVSGLLDKIGIKMNEIKSGSLKAAPSPFQPASPEARRVAEEMIANGKRWFIGLVEERRKIKVSDIPGLSEGRVYLGSTALKYKLVDAIGGEKTAVAWLAENRNISANTRIVDWKPENTVDWQMAPSLSSLLSQVIVETATTLSRSTLLGDHVDSLGLNGLVSIWKTVEN